VGFVPIQNVMNTYRKALTGSKRETHSRLLKAVLLGRSLVKSADLDASTVTSGS
jgi:hypothetical protein